MGRDDWYRGSAWDEGTQRAFWEKLARARTQRGQYLLLKGMEVARADDRRIRAAGRDLLRQMLSEHPEEPVNVGRALHALGESFEQDGSLDDARSYYRQAVDYYDAHGGMETGADLALAEVIVALGRSELYAEARECLERFRRRGSPFPSEQFKWLLAETRIAARSDRDDEARGLAIQALDLLEHNQAPFPRHPTIGLIEVDRLTVRELKRLAK